MKFTTLTPIVSAFLLVGVHGLEDSPIPGYGVVPFSWEVQTVPGGPTVVVNGTVQEVYSQLKAINPNFETDFPPIQINDTKTDGLEKRDNILCDPFSDLASASAISSGINYLRGVPGTPTNGPGPGNCGRVSCSYNSAIWWCNDNTYTFSLPSFNNIADSAQLLMNVCNVYDTNTFSGQDFHSDNWNGIVRGAGC